MNTAPTDGTRVLIKAVVTGYVPERRGSHFRVHKPIGSRWVECRYIDGAWQEWCGVEDRRVLGTIEPIEWAPLPEVTA